MIRKVMLFTAGAVLSINTALADVSGKWGFAVDIAGMGSGNAEVSMEQAADGAITGTYSGQLGNTSFTGKADGDAFEFTLNSDMGAVKYEGELQADGTLKGTMNLAGMGGGTFVGTRK